MFTRMLSLVFVLVLCPVVAVFAADKNWRLFDVKGKASMLSPDGSRSGLSNEKNLLEPLGKGSRIKVEGQGKVVIVSLKNRQAFEVGDNSEALVTDDRIEALKGTVTIKKGYALPSAKDGRMAGTVMRGAVNSRSCLKAVSPVNTAILDNAPQLTWENVCDGLKQVTITLMSDDRIVHTGESGTSTFRVPTGILKPGNRYMWLIDGGANFDMASGVFSILTDQERNEVQELAAASKTEFGDDIGWMISYVFYLDEIGLKELARQESEKIKKQYPGAAGLKELP